MPSILRRRPPVRRRVRSSVRSRRGRLRRRAGRDEPSDERYDPGDQMACDELGAMDRATDGPRRGSRGPFTLTDSQPSVGAHPSSWERLCLARIERRRSCRPICGWDTSIPRMYQNVHIGQVLKGTSQNPDQVSGPFRNSLNLMSRRDHDGSPKAISRTYLKQNLLVALDHSSLGTGISMSLSPGYSTQIGLST